MSADEPRSTSTPLSTTFAATHPPLTLSLSCRKCNLTFKKREQLANHLQYFCQGGKYSDIEALKNSLVVNQNMSVDSLRQMLSTGASAIGDVSLGTLRERIRSDTASLTEVKSEVLRSRQAQLVAELRDLKVKHSKSVFDRMQQQSKVDNVMNNINNERGTEIRSRIERERLRDALKCIEQTDLVALEQEQRRNLEELVKEQEILKQKEAVALQEIERLMQMIQKSETDKQTDERPSNSSGAQIDDIRLKFARTGEELGKQAALLRLERERKVAERDRIMERLKNPVADDAQQREELINKLKTGQKAEIARLEQLKAKLNNFRKEQESIVVKLWEVDADPIAEHDSEPAKKSTVLQPSDQPLPQPITHQPKSDSKRIEHPSPQKEPSNPEPKNASAEADAGQISTANEQGAKKVDEEKQKLMEELESLKRIVKEIQQQSTPSVKHESNSQFVQPIHQQYAPNVPSMPMMQATSPLILQLQQQMAQTQLILQQHQTENARLYQELSDLDSSHEAARFEQQRRDFESTLRLLTSKLQGQIPQNTAADSKSDESKAGFRSAPPNSELFKIEMEYQAKIARLRYQKELQAEELELARVREQTAMKAKELEEERRHAEYMAEQRRKLERQRMKQELAKDLPLSDFRMPTNSNYNPLDGFLIVWDFVYGLDKSILSVKVAHQILDGSSPKSEIAQSEIFETQPDGPSPNSNRVCIFAATNHINRIPALPTLKLLVEVQSANSVKKESIGWTLFHIFSEQSTLLSGLWRAPLYTGPIRRDLVPNNLGVNLAACKHPTAQLFLRIAAANESNIQPGGDPNLVMHLYNDQAQNRLVLPRESRANSTNVSRPLSARSDSKIKQCEPVLSAVADMVKKEPQPNAIPTSVDIGIGIRSAELPGATYARVRISVGSGFTWSSSYAQAGADGDLGVFRWEAPCTYRNCPIDDTVVLDIITRPDRPTSAPSGFEIQPGEAVLGWAMIDAISSDKQLRIGSVDIALQPPPVSPTLRSDAKIEDAIVRVYLFSPDSSPAFQPVSLLIDESVGSSFSVLPWIDYARPVSLNEPLFERGDGFDVYVDSCRFLPDNVLASRARLEMWTSEFGVSVGGPVTKVCSVEGTIRNPKYDLRREYRAHAFNPTCTIEVIVEGIERDSRKLKFVGVAALNVFSIRGGQVQPAQAQQQEFCLNSGSFQLPLYAELVRSKDVFLASSYSNVSKIPCATVLVRIVPAAKSKDFGEVLSTTSTPESEWIEKGLVLPAPSYNVGKYDSTKCRPSALEVKLYNIISKKESILVETVLDQLGEEAEDILQKGMQAVQAWIEQKFDQLSPPNGQTAQPLNMSRFAPYQQSVGLCIAVDGAWYVGDGKALPFALYSLSPPGDFYKPFRLTDDVHVTGQWDWDSHLRWPSFTSGYTTFRESEYNEFAVAVIDVRLLRGTLVEVFGWTVLQLFTSDGYVQTGLYQLPLIKGVPPADVLDILQNERATAVLAREMSKQGTKKRKAAKLPALVFAEPASVLVRLADAQAAELGPKKNSFRKMQLEYVEWERRDKYECDLDQVTRGNVFGLGAKPLKLSTLKASNQDTLKQFEMATLKTIAAELGIDRLNT